MILSWVEKVKRWLESHCFPNEKRSKSPSSLEKGNRGELLAYRYLKRQGYRIVARQYHSRSGEIDLIGWDEDILAFIEVKYRRRGLYGRPEEAVNRSKQRQICRVARDYRRRLSQHNLSYRFDIVSIQGAWQDPEVRIIKDAFKEQSKRSL